MAARTGLWPDRGTAVGAYAIAPSGERGSFADRLPLPIRGRARMSTALDAPHRSVHLPPSLLPRVVGIRDFFVCLFRAAIGAPDGFGRSAFVAMSALGLGRRRLLVPIGILAAGATLITFCMTLWLGPLSVRTFRVLEDHLRTGQASFQVAPRVFDERFPRFVLYVNDIDSTATRWKGVFLAGTDAKDMSRLTLAEEAIVIADRNEGKLELHLRNGSTHEFSLHEPGNYSLSAFAERDLPVEARGLDAGPASEPSVPGRTLRTLLRERGAGARDASVEIQRRLSFPFACVSFALVAVPLGARPRLGGRAP